MRYSDFISLARQEVIAVSNDQGRRKKIASDKVIDEAFASVKITLKKTKTPKKTAPTPKKEFGIRWG